MIVSVSRRCDIPRFQFTWFMEQLNAGFVEVPNPYNRRHKRRISLLPKGNPGLRDADSQPRAATACQVPAKADIKPEEGVDAFVFWTRDPRNILTTAEELTKRGFPFYVMVTVTGYPPALEPGMVHTPKVVTAIRELSQKIGPDRVIWRYDPILISSITDEDFHRLNFTALAQSLAGSVRRVIISLYDEYKGSKQRLDAKEKSGELRMMDAGAGLTQLLADLAGSAEAAGMEIQSCAEKEDYSSCGIKPGACIDAALIEKHLHLQCGGRDKNQRPHCLCCQSVDIGRYGMCAARCVYCYTWW